MCSSREVDTPRKINLESKPFWPAMGYLFITSRWHRSHKTAYYGHWYRRSYPYWVKTLYFTPKTYSMGLGWIVNIALSPEFQRKSAFVKKQIYCLFIIGLYFRIPSYLLYHLNPKGNLLLWHQLVTLKLKKAPFGFSQVPAHLQQLITEVLKGLPFALRCLMISLFLVRISIKTLNT